MIETIEVQHTALHRDVIDYDINGTIWKVPFIKFGLEKVVDWKRDDIWKENPNIGTALISARFPKRFNECQLKPVNDIDTGIRIGWGSGEIDKNTGMPLVGSYKIDQLTMELNLAIPHQQKLYFFIATNPMVLDSPNCWSKKNSMLEIVDKNADAKARMRLRELKFEAMTKAKSIEDFKQIKDIVSVFSDLEADVSDDQIRDAFQDYAEKHPKEFTELLTSSDRAYKIVYAKADKMNIIQMDLELGVMFGQVRLGLNEEEVIHYFKRNPEMFRHIGNAISDEEKSIEKSVDLKGSSSETLGHIVDNAVKEENADLKRKLLDQSSQLAELQTKMEEFLNSKSEQTREDIDSQKKTIIEVADKPVEKMNLEELASYCIEQGYEQSEWSKFKLKKELLLFVKDKLKPSKKIIKDKKEIPQTAPVVPPI